MTWNHLGMCQAVGYPQSGIQWASSKDTDKHERISQLVSIQTWYRSRPICESLWIHIQLEGLCMFAKWEQWVQSTTITVTCWNQLISSKGMGEWRLDKTSQQDVRLWKPDTEVMDSRLEGFSARPKLLQYLCSNFTLIATSDITKAASNSTLQRVSPHVEITQTAGAPVPAFCATRTSKKVTKTRPVTEPKEVSSRATSPNLTSFTSYSYPTTHGSLVFCSNRLSRPWKFGE